jgi:tRNA G37 N-methylase Trm5
MAACPSLLELAHASIQRAVTPGSLVVDATAGNGKDTLFLAGLVGPVGLVLAFDIQPEALEKTRTALEKARLATRVRLLLTGHENVAACLQHNVVSAAMFNLGFLPGSTKEIATRPSTTLAALNGLLPAMLPGSLLSIHRYGGHDGGKEESKAVLDWAARQPEENWRIYRYETWNKKRGAENLLLMERRAAFSRGRNAGTGKEIKPDPA